MRGLLHPLCCHVIVRDHTLTFETLANSLSVFDRVSRRVCRPAGRLGVSDDIRVRQDFLQPLAMFRFREFKDWLPFDPVSRQNVPPSFSIYLDRAVTYSQAIPHPQPVWENCDARDLSLVRPSRIVEMHATRPEVCAYELQKL